MLDYWLRNSDAKPTWNDVADGLRKIGFYELAEKVHHPSKCDGCAWRNVQNNIQRNLLLIVLSDNKITYCMLFLSCHREPTTPVPDFQC